MIKGGVTYGQVREWWEAVHCGDRARLNRIGDGLRKHELMDLLATLNSPAPVVEGPAVIIVHRKYTRHFIVITADGEILDPAK